MSARRRLVVLAVLLRASYALAQVDCGTPGNLCSGDPCVIPSLAVASPCVVDFRPRTVIVNGTLRLPPNGTLSLTAGALQVHGSVLNTPPARGAGGSGPQVSLTATGDVDLDGRMRLNGKLVPGSLAVDAGGALHVGGSITTSTRPTSITLDAAGDVDLSGTIVTPPGVATIGVTAGGRIDLAGRIRNMASLVMQAGGDVDLTGALLAQSQAGTVTVEAGGMLTAGSLVHLPLFALAFRGAAGARVERPIAVNAVFDAGGSVEVSSAAGDVTIDAIVRAGAVQLTAGGDVLVQALVSASEPARSGGSIVVSSPSGNVTLDAALQATGGDGNLPTDGAGGDVQVTAGGTLSVADDISVNSSPLANAPGGSVRLEGGTVHVGPGVTVDARGCRNPNPCDFFRPPALLHFAATAGDLGLDGTFLASGGATVIEGSASADLVTAGQLTAGPAGCIALAAGGTLDTTGATFDRPVLPSCP